MAPMLWIKKTTIVFALLAPVFARFVPAKGIFDRDDVATVDPNVCGEIITWANNDTDSNYLIRAKLVHDCLQSVPLLKAVALRYIDYFNTTMQFQSTLAYLKDPPPSYRQPAVDVEAELGTIRYNVSTDYYQNQYAFELALQHVVQRMHDAHVTLSAGILRPFFFGSPHDIMSLSVDGIQAPQVFLKDDVVGSLGQGWQPHPIKTINGQEATSYLKRFASLNAPGAVEAHTEWNQLMWNPIQDLLGTGNVFGWTATFYPGDELVFELENGTSVADHWLALYNEREETGPLTTPGDFYNYFVLGLRPFGFTPPDEQSTNTANVTPTDDTGPTDWASISPAFPAAPDVVQEDLGGSAYTTGYFLRDISTAVLSMPSFADGEQSFTAFSNVTAQFVRQAQASGMRKVIIDLQQNRGGAAPLAFDTFAYFFPNITPFAGSRRRDSPLANILGNTITDYWTSLAPRPGVGQADQNGDYYYYASNEWVVTNRLNAATGRPFTSWPEYYGPVVNPDGEFSMTEQYNLTDITFIGSSLDGSDTPALGDDDGAPFLPTWTKDDIVILTDGMCSSTCALFVEMMKHQAGVRTVVMGGTPDAGPMQAVGGTRGARLYDADQLDSDMQVAREHNASANLALPLREQAIWTYYMSVNLRDQVRQNQSVPLQFQYEAADCRLYYTIANAFSMDRLWRDVAAAAFYNSSLCVSGPGGNDISIPEPPTFESIASSFQGSFQGTPGVAKDRHDVDLDDEYSSGISAGGLPGPFTAVDASGRCNPPYKPHTVLCPQKAPPFKMCGDSCRKSVDDCGPEGECRGAPLNGARGVLVFGGSQGDLKNKDTGLGTCMFTGKPGRKYGCY